MFEQLHYDDNGNIYITNKNTGDIYMLSIDRDDNLVLDKIINKQYNDNTNISPIKKNKKQNDLQIKAIHDAITEFNQNDLEDYDENQIQEIADRYTEYSINPEYKFYNHDDDDQDNLSDSDNDSTCYDDNQENKFNFYGNLNKSMLLFDPPCFETLVLGDLMQVIFRTSIKNNQPFYRITFYSNNTIDLNIIGTKIKSYSIDWNNIAIELTNNN